MEPASSGWPTTAWPLTAPESYVLLHGPKASGAETFKMALLELVTRGALRVAEVEEPSRFGRTKPISVLTPGAKAVAPTAPSLAGVWTLYNAIPLRTFANGTIGVAVEEVARAAQRHYRSLSQYVAREVLPTLIDRGYYAREEYRILWLFPASRVVVTPAGQAMRADLVMRMALANERLGEWVSNDAARALAFVGLAGASVLLMSSTYPDLQHLNERLRQTSTAGGDAGSGGDAGYGPRSQDRPDHTDEQPTDTGTEAGGGLGIGGLDLSGLSFDFDLSTFDSIGDAFSAIDAGVNSGGGDGGGDGGGNGGGNGGNGGE